ncbi:hypothetical protein GTQ43_03645 [Nostoc sp. KVJ3]|uniref:hypothetical protein n=1 Tax=Nostoc sp. KVJ3 TaxID=457945 RepID=UPI00223773F2|nr:hypothetical protein [Nostoc sp. KVJ3]MCW5312975.1 hypothetical protein [Nostoc sp. KVJ3]
MKHIKLLHKNKAVLSLSISLVVIIAGYLPTLASSQRYPSNGEMQKIKSDFIQLIKRFQQNEANREYIRDRRTSAQKHEIQSFVKAWLEVNPNITPFLGLWTGYEQTVSIYPSNVKGKVCIISTEEELASFTVGTVSNRQIHTRGVATYIKEGNYLGIAVVIDNKPQLNVTSPLANPEPLKTPVELIKHLAIDANQISTIAQSFKSHGCIFSRPK